MGEPITKTQRERSQEWCMSDVGEARNPFGRLSGSRRGDVNISV
jgi:hypothetical protein